jgi:carbamoyltransferase
MEFGPRALGNRSILIDPRKANVNQTVNKRLKRTEFMPFAPIVLENYFDLYFESQNVSKQPFYYMTSTCMVRPEYRSAIPAVTHVDGTARPQIVTKESNAIVTQILEEFCLLTGVPVLVNTSFNVHEEPINFQLEDSLEALERNAVDMIYTNHGRITLRNPSF